MKNNVFKTGGKSIANPQICKEKGSVSDPYPHWFDSNTFFCLRKYILDYEMPCNCPKSQKSSLNLNGSFFRLIFIRRKILYFRKCGSIKSTKNNWARKLNIWSANRKSPHPQIHKFNKSKKMKSENLLICDLRNLFADCLPANLCKLL